MEILTNQTFEELGINKKYILDALAYFNFKYTTKIQAESIPKALLGHNLISQAPSGTGKTLAFTCIILQTIIESENNLQALIITPTRELALQIFDFFNEMTFTAENPVYTLLCCGGYSRADTIKSISQGVHVVVGTMGRIRDMIEHDYLSLDSLKLLVMDEADKLLTSCS